MTQQLITTKKREPNAKGFCVESISDASLHLLPCQIDYEGPAAVEQYFVIDKQDEELQTAHFRGRELLGATVHLPNGFCGYVGQKKGETIHLNTSFDAFTCWKREIKPSKRDPVHSWLSWPEISQAIHKPTSESQSDVS